MAFKFINTSLLSLFAATASFAADQQEPASVAETIVSQELSPLFSEVQDNVSFFSNANPAVLAGSQEFLLQLQKAYQSQEISESDIERVNDAVSFAARKHRFQTRDNAEKTPYIIHPIGVAYNLITTGQVRDADILIAALLHDTVEDTNTTLDEIGEAFGKTVAGYVAELTDDKSLPLAERKRLQIVNASKKSVGAAQVKLADKLYNLRDLLNATPEGWTKDQVHAYFGWTLQVINNLPEANGPLKIAVETCIAAHVMKSKLLANK